MLKSYQHNQPGLSDIVVTIQKGRRRLPKFANLLGHIEWKKLSSYGVTACAKVVGQLSPCLCPCSDIADSYIAAFIDLLAMYSSETSYN